MKAVFCVPIVAALVCCGCARTPEQAPPVEHAANRPNPTLPLIGYIDVPQQDNVTVRANEDFSIGGWAVWGQTAHTVNLLLDGAPLAAVPINIARPDVARIHAQYGSANSGWGTAIPKGRMPAGSHKLTVQVVSSSGQTQELKTLTIDVLR